MADPKSLNEGAPLFERPPGYRSYLLRFWEERSDELPAAVWRFSLEDPLSGQRHGFADLDALVKWIKDKMTRSELAED